jgi:hypothetical protein
VKWDRAQLTWSPVGYVLEAPLRVDARAVHECREELERKVADLVDEAGFVSLSAVGWDPRMEGADSPRLEVVTAELPSTTSAGRLRETVSDILAAASERSKRAEQDEEPRIEATLAAIREP